MRYIISGLTFLLIPIIVNGVLGYLRQPKEAEDGKVYLHKLLAILGAIASAIFLIPTIITAFSDGLLWESFVLLLFSSLSATLVIAFVNCRISYDEDGFVSKNFFGIKRKFTYDQVTAIKENIHETFIYIGKRRIMVDELSIGGDDFINFVKKKYRTIHDGQNLPRIHKTKHDIFNGNIRDSGQFLFAYILMSALVIGFLIFAVYYTYVPSTPSNTIEQTVSFVSCDVTNEEVVLTSSDNQIYRICFIDEQFNAEDIQALCDGEMIVTAFSKEITPDDGEDYYSVKAIEYNNTYILSFDETNKFHRQEYFLLVIVAIVMCIVWSVIFVLSIIIGRNPKKFSKRVVRLFFKERYVRY